MDVTPRQSWYPTLLKNKVERGKLSGLVSTHTFGRIPSKIVDVVYSNEAGKHQLPLWDAPMFWVPSPPIIACENFHRAVYCPLAGAS